MTRDISRAPVPVNLDPESKPVTPKEFGANERAWKKYLALARSSRVKTKHIISVDTKGELVVLAIVHIVVSTAASGEMRVRAGVVDYTVHIWHPSLNRTSPLCHFNWAEGLGYDLITAALAGASVGGTRLGDHPKGPLLDQVIQTNNWLSVGSFR